MLGYEEEFIQSIKWEDIGKINIKEGKKISENIDPLFTKIPDEVIEKQIKKLKESATKEHIEIDATDETIDIEYFKN